MSNKKKFLTNILQLVILLGLGIFCIWFSFRGLSSDDYAMIRESASSVNNAKGWLFLSLSILAGAASHFVRSLRSRLLLEPLNYKVRVSSAFYSVMVCYLANLAVPRLGEILRCTFLQRYEKVPFQKTLGTIVTERVLDLACWLLLLICALLLNTAVLSQLIVDKANNITLSQWFELKFLTLLHSYWIYIIIATIALLIYFTRHFWKKVTLFVKLKKVILEIWQGVISIKDLKHPWLFLFYTLLLWFFYFMGTFICFFAFDYLAPLGPMPAFSVLVFGTIGFMVTQGGLGAYPLMVAGILILYGVDYNAGLAAGWVGWSVQSAMVIIFGAASLILASIASRQKSEVIDNK
ncbi:MAG: flippase-like domain-containing protein [Bacteroidales bacterium]|jgi:uncharacterized protein (TIRG00374 family)|nr:flippase-like domain-containing protein [Bacteroidales bacterium]